MSKKPKTYKLAFTELQLRELMQAMTERRETLRALIADEQAGNTDPNNASIWNQKLVHADAIFAIVSEEVYHINWYNGK